MKYILILFIALILFSCKENNEKSNNFHNWEFIKSQVQKDSLIKELELNLDTYDGIVINEVNYNLFGDNELYRQRINSYFNYDNNINNISSLKINYNQILKDSENIINYEEYFKTNENFKNIDFMNN